jgi:carbamoyltransferase
MLVLGLSGGLDAAAQERSCLFLPGLCHDAAAVLVEDGEVVHAIEQERLNRIKHTSKGPAEAVHDCLESRGLRLAEIDKVIYYGSEAGCDSWLQNLAYSVHDADLPKTYRALIHEFFADTVGEPLAGDKLHFINHHLAHAVSAFAQSGFEQSLVVTIDGAGDGLSGSVSRFAGSDFQTLATIPDASSLGIFYDRVIAMLGYGFTEEFKVMGLAPYGDPDRFAAEFRKLYELRPGGAYVIHWDRLSHLYSLAALRRPGDPILQDHMDIAAGLQATLERIVFHLLTFFRESSGLSSLCLAGGVAHNSSMNGKILYSGLFSEIFVQPASGDSGCALGAALAPSLAAGRNSRQAIRHVFWGTEIGESDAVAARLERWSGLVDFAMPADVASCCGGLLAAGEVIGWAQGRSEFGPRALGHRSILADPRPAENKDIINAMVKKRESFRPFAPAVQEEHLDTYFEMPRPGMSVPFMSFTLRVRPEHRERLGAITHVDGTARVQTVSREVDPLFWDLIERFRQQAEIPIVLNTSFNNYAEPIVDSIDDAVACFLTTGLQRLAIGSFVVSEKPEANTAILRFCALLPSHARLVEETQFAQGRASTRYTIASGHGAKTQAISVQAYEVLRATRPGHPVGDHAAAMRAPEPLAEELWELWRRRAIAIRPA